MEEFISRTRFQIVNDQDEADAVLDGAINQATLYSHRFRPRQRQGRPKYKFPVILQLSMADRRTGKMLFSRPAFTVQNNYEVANSSNVTLAEHEYFDESSASLNRLSRDVARTW